MKYLKSFFLALLDLMFTIFVCILVNWWAPLFANEQGYLPGWLAWVGTFDDTLDAGVRDKGWAPGYWSRVRWLYRNPGYGFGYYALGVPFNPTDWTVVRYTTEPLDFYATSISGDFCLHSVKGGWLLKIGAKAWNMYDTNAKTWKTAPWGPEWRVPTCFSISRA